MLGWIYRLAETEYIWSLSTTWYERNWINTSSWLWRWLTGELAAEYSRAWEKFHAWTFSFFEDGYHFFGNLEWISVLVAATLAYYLNWTITIDGTTALAFWFCRFLGTQIGLRLLFKRIEVQSFFDRLFK